MSASEEKAKEVSATAADEGAGAPGKDKTGGLVFIFFILGLAASLLVGWVIFPKVLYSQKKQPVDFNHASHNEMVMDGCQSCHFFRSDGTYAGVPTLAQCIECHEVVQGGSEEEVKFVEEYVWKRKEIPWNIYSRQPDCVFFSHAAHVIAGDMDCVTCHGHIGESESLPIYEENIITGYSRNIWGKNISGMKTNTWDRMKMDDCAECHRENDVKQSSVQTLRGACFVCHK